jgi:threonine/homoserine/homoserine lactone efflux protein
MVSMLANFLLASLVLTIVPGPDGLVVMRNGLRGRAAAVATGAGTGAGALTWGLAAAVGLAVVLQRSSGLYEVIKLIGAAYLTFLGVTAIRRARRGRGTTAVCEVDDRCRPPMRRMAAFRDGFVSDLFSPKTGLFYVAIVPQIIPSQVPVFWGTLIFGAVDGAVTTTWFALLVCLAARCPSWLRGPRVARVSERITGTFLVGIGVRAALERS